jgi:dipeptidyl aminopeptidase/acylaminoacyl peptidase
LIVMDHGGPTGATTASLRWGVQFWTQRGFAVVDVNYGGSTGYGRAYRERLKGRWGIVDVEDSIDAARFLIERGVVDPARVVIRGSSAGGYTTLAALTFHEFFAAGASHYGIGDLETLARDTHKFESRYLDGLVGPYPAARDLYRERSPVHHTERLSSALILLQGAEDKVVPAAQAEAMYSAVRAKGLPVAYLLFEHEQHGFRRAENIRRALEAELWFYGRVLGFAPADVIEPVPIANLPPGP